MWGHLLDATHSHPTAPVDSGCTGIPLGSTTIQPERALERPEHLQKQGFRPFSLRYPHSPISLFGAPPSP